MQSSLAFICVASCIFYVSAFSSPLSPKPPPPPLIPREVLVGDKDVYDVQISPDGRYVAFLHPHNYQLNVWLWDRRARWQAPRPVTNEKNRSISDFQWAADNRTIIFAQDVAGEENYRLYAIDIKNATSCKTPRLLTPAKNVRSELVYVSATRPRAVAVASNERDSSTFDLYEVDLLNGEKKVILKNDQNFKDCYIDDMLIVKAAAKENAAGGMDYYYADANGTLDFARTVGPDERLNTRLLLVDAAGTTLYWLDSSKFDKGVLVAENADTGNTTELYRAQKSEISMDHVFLHPKTNRPLIVYEDYKRLTPIVLHADIEKDFQRLRKLLPPDFVPVVKSASFDLAVWVVKAVASRRPAEYVVFSPRNRTHPITYLFSEKSGLLLYPLADTVTIEVPVADNMTQICYMTKPVDVGVGKAAPMVLYVHGGPWTRDNWGFDTTTQTLANRGYVVLRCNFRGSTGFGKRFLNAGNGQWAGKMQQDLTDAVKWAIKAGVAIPDRIAIAGASYGGFAVLTALTQNPTMYACGIDVFGPSNLSTLFEGIPRYWKSELNSMKRRIGADPDTEAGRALLRKWSPLTYADRIKRPLLVVHGANDARVRRIESDAIVQSAKHNNVSVTYVLFPDEGHSIDQAFNGLALNAILEQFLAKCLGGRAQPIGDALTKSTAIIS